jgi:hypothetical protein
MRGTGIGRGVVGAGPMSFVDRTTLTRPAVLLGDSYIDNNVFGLFAHAEGYVTGGFNGFWDIDASLDAKLIEYLGWRVSDFAFADFDGDGDEDVMTTATDEPSGSDGSITRAQTMIWERTATGLVARSGFDDAVESRTHFAIGDVDEDGELDLVSYGEGGVTFVHKGEGDFSFSTGLAVSQSAGVYGGAPYALLLNDDDGDGHLDLSAALHDHPTAGMTTTIVWQRGDGAGEFEPAVGRELNVHAEQVAFGEVTGDGHLDIVLNVAEQTDNGLTARLQIMRGTGPGTYGERETLIDYVNGIELVDLDGDGTQEIARWTLGLTVFRVVDGVFESFDIDVGSRASAAAIISRSSGGEPEVAALFMGWCEAGCDSSCQAGCIFDSCRECLTSADCAAGQCLDYRCMTP